MVLQPHIACILLSALDKTKIFHPSMWFRHKLKLKLELKNICSCIVCLCNTQFLLRAKCEKQMWEIYVCGCYKHDVLEDSQTHTPGT